ncbi:hypothetical protein CJF30_00008942 [Rutstroemia sp. NJR-2017a BBW]|nr:hypothetical protein CJF30_00008942 [Rutstroemia sp. NJR-2017a BBW]
MVSLSRRGSSAMEISSIINNTEHIQSDKMDITMVLNPSDIKPEIDEPLHHMEASGYAESSLSRGQFILPIREPSCYIEQYRPISVDTLQSYQSQLACLGTRRADRPRRQLPSVPLHQRPLSHSLASFNYSPPTSLPHFNDYHYRRHHYSSSPIFRHAHHSRSHRKTKSVKAHSNKAYTEEEVHFIRYHKDDLGLKWEPLLVLFKRAFPTRARESDQCLSSRYYRTNKFRLFDENDKFMRDENGKIMYLSAKVRGRSTPEGKAEALPYTLVQMNPQKGLKYSWVKEIHKKEMRILAAEMDDEARERMHSNRAQRLRKEREDKERASGRESLERSSSISMSDDSESSTAGSPPPAPYRASSERQYTPFSPV